MSIREDETSSARVFLSSRQPADGANGLAQETA